MNEEIVYDVSNMSDEDAESYAKDIGWRPLEEFDNSKGNWTDAKTYLSNTNKFDKIMKSNYKTLKEKVSNQEKMVASLLEQNQAAYRQGYEFALQENKIKLAEAQAEKEEALADSDLSTLKKIERKEKALIEQQKELETKINPQPNQNLTQEDIIAIQVWEQTNDWYGNDKQLYAMMNGSILQIRNENPNLKLSEILRRATEEVKEAMPHKFQDIKKVNPVLGNDSFTGSSSDVKNFSSIPALDREFWNERWAACERQYIAQKMPKEKINELRKNFEKICVETHNKGKR